MYLESDCSKWEWGYDGNTINVLKLLRDGLFYTMGSGCVKSVSLLGVPSLLSVRLTEVLYYPFILKGLSDFFPCMVKQPIFSFSLPHCKA